jgi:hypothetical protein
VERGRERDGREKTKEQCVCVWTICCLSVSLFLCSSSVSPSTQSLPQCVVDRWRTAVFAPKDTREKTRPFSTYVVVAWRRYAAALRQHTINNALNRGTLDREQHKRESERERWRERGSERGIEGESVETVGTRPTSEGDL